MSFASTQTVPGLVHLDFDSIHGMSKALLRAQEFAENPKFLGKVFTTSRIKNYYHGQAYKLFVGYNIPGDAVDQFALTFPCITRAEQAVLDHLETLQLGRYYIIASADHVVKRPSWKAGDHEIAHGLWYLNDYYRAEQQASVARLPEKHLKSLRDRLLTWGIYGPQVLDDEVHAYLATDELSKLSSRFHWHVLPKEVVECHNEMNSTLQRTLGRI